MTYDLLLVNGHVLDPGQGIDDRLDIAIAGGRIAAVEREIPPGQARQVLDLGGTERYVVPGLIDVHTHVAYGATTSGVGMECCEPDFIGVESGVTTVLDAGSVGVANVGVLAAHVVDRARTRIICYLNVGSHAHTMPGKADVTALTDVDADAIRACVAANPGLVRGLKLRLVGPLVLTDGEEIVARSKAIAREHGLPLMVHIGDLSGTAQTAARMQEVTRFLIESFEPGDILTHLCTPNVGGVMHAFDQTAPLLAAARARGVVLDSALGMGNFGHRVAREQRAAGLGPDTISSDLTVFGQSFHSLLECMAKFMAVGYSLSEVVAMTTANAARAIGLDDTLGAVAAGREADLTVFDVVPGEFEFTDTVKESFTGEAGLVPVQTIRAGVPYAPRWGTHPWGWLPARATAAGTPSPAATAVAATS
ncbi:amidohydrolase family protein [Phytohabitans sp. ZYX-F-186]|uniref:Amidohydrolase family protein n=1 Tax=Phytohabitans maris TaxID=3071409 RepID=A0ABU0ZML8_9ACTN|nr:amidohydrolase family protein [Phytohabitans sp. ZYX-F-186]MDQ7907520.1 amidohydrolase family protein [Phytohabitans sp. ZYX-F-186]